MKFKIGDRVRVYVCLTGTPLESDGTIYEIDSDKRMRVNLDKVTTTAGKLIYVHPKQCRRLRPKQRRVYYIPLSGLKDRTALHTDDYTDADYGNRHYGESTKVVELVERRKGKK